MRLGEKSICQRTDKTEGLSKLPVPILCPKKGIIHNLTKLECTGIKL